MMVGVMADVLHQKDLCEEKASSQRPLSSSSFVLKKKGEGFGGVV
jgi:hypothetical protein